MQTDAQLEWVRPPQQVRSQQTLERLLDAAEASIIEQGLQATSVSEIARRARSSVGAFYARFPDKEALMRSVFERFVQQSEATMDSVLRPERWEGVPLEDLLQAALRFLFRVTRERRALVTSFITYASRDAAVTAWLDRLTLHGSMRVYRLLDARGELPKRKDPAVAVGLATGVILSVSKARLLRPADYANLIEDAVVVREVAQMILAYLEHDKRDDGVKECQ